MGSIRKVRMYPLDFEEFLYANGMNDLVISSMRKKFERMEALEESMHSKMMDLFRKYLLVGGLPDAVNAYLETKNIQRVREIQNEIHDYYAADASKYDAERKLKIRRVYDLIPSNMENKKKRVVAQSIEEKKGKTFADYQDEFEYLISAGIALNVQAISNPVFPLIESSGKNLLKLYLNDVGILTGILYGNNIRAILDDERSINLGSVYESVVASELAAHGHKLFYYDNLVKAADMGLENVKLKKDSIKGDKEAMLALKAMLKAAQKDGVYGFYLVSAYRDYAEQQALWDKKVATVITARTHRIRPAER